MPQVSRPRAWTRWKKPPSPARWNSMATMSAGRRALWASLAPPFTGGWRNMASDRFRAGMTLRVALILSTALLLSYVAMRTDWYVSMGLLALAVMGETMMLIHFATRW